jgi:hypothetical protein
MVGATAAPLDQSIDRSNYRLIKLSLDQTIA